jgi:hypothetical protein
VTLHTNQGQYDRLSDASSDVERALQEWKDAGGSIFHVMQAINELIDLRVQIAKENSRE